MVERQYCRCYSKQWCCYCCAPGTANITVTATNGTDDTKDDKTATCSVTVRQPPIVTFKVFYGSWDDGNTADKQVTLTAQEGDAWKLTAEQIPAVGSKPVDTDFNKGDWLVAPDDSTVITGDTTYYYCYQGFYIRMGTYKGVDVDWYLAKKNNIGYFMLCKYSLKYGAFGKNSTYKTSYIHDWLDINSGGTFAADLGLTQEELTLVRTVDLSSTAGDGTDQFIIPAYYGNNSELDSGSPYKKAYYIDEQDYMPSMFWLRSGRYGSATELRVVRQNIDTIVAARYTNSTNDGKDCSIRPMFYLDTTVMNNFLQDGRLKGSGTEDDPYYVYIPLIGVSLDQTQTALRVDGRPVALNASVIPARVSDKDVRIKWTVTQGDDNVKLYADYDCTQELETDFTDKLTVYVKGISAGEAAVNVITNMENTESADCTITAMNHDEWVSHCWGEGNEGTAEKPYVIADEKGWELLVDDHYSGYDYTGKIFRLSDDLTVTTMPTMIGTAQTGFSGTFEGNGKTLTFDYSGTDDYIAPFRYVNGGTIKDLTVDGTITADGQYVGGIIGQAVGETTIENCKFTGKLLTTGSTTGGGFVAYNNGTLTINNSLYAPAEIKTGETEPGEADTATFALNNGECTSSITNSYYLRELGTEQGTRAYSVTAGDGITVTLAENSAKGFIHDGKIYAGSGETVSLTISEDNTKDGYAFIGDNDSAGMLTESEGKYSLTMPAENVTVSGFTVITSGMTSLTAGIYVVKENVTVSALTLEGDVNLILCDGAALTVTENISGEHSLTLYGQNSGTGTLTAAAISLTKNLTVNGGVITAEISVDGTVTVKNATVNDNTYDADGYSTTSYTVTFDSNGGSAVDSQTLTFRYGETPKAAEPDEPTRPNYNFLGWQLNGSAYDFDTEVSEDITLTAEWNPKGGKSQDDDPTKPTFRSHSLMLEGEIGVNFYMNLPQLDGVNYDDHNNCYMEFDISGDKSNALKYRDADISYTENGNKYYGFRCYISSVQMADTITALLNYGDGLTVSQDYSVQEYLDAILDGDYTGEAKDLMIAIQNYGYYAQQMLSKANNWTIGEKYAAIKRASQSDYDETEISEVNEATEQYTISRDVGNSQIQEVQYSLLLDSNTTINVYLEVKEGYSGAVTATLDGGTANVATKLSSKEYLVQIRNIPAHELSKIHTITVTAGESFTVKVAALSYVYTVLNSAVDSIGGVDIATMKNGVTALYKYYNAAMTYAGRN